MERKFCLEDGKEVKIGDEICIERIKTSELGEIRRTTIFTVTEDNVDKLIAKGIIAEIKDLPLTIKMCLDMIATKAHMSSKEVMSLYIKLMNIYPASVLSMLLRVIALHFDSKYEGHIASQERVFVIDVKDGEIHSLDSNDVRNWGHFAAFRTIEDAVEARQVVKPILDRMYGRKQED